jgi:type II secretory pathway component GspD/PulD (secretin)
VAKLLAVDDVDEEATRYNSSLIINISNDVGTDRVNAEVRPAGYAAYEVIIGIMPEITPPPAQPVEEVKPPAPEPVIETVKEEVVEPVPEPQEVEVPKEDVEIKITVEPVTEPVPTPPFVEPKPEEKSAPVAVEKEIKPVEIKKPEAPKPAIPVEEKIAPLPVSTEKPEEGISYPTFKVEVQPAVNGVDRFVINFTGQASEPEVNRFSHPSRLMLVFSNCSPDTSEKGNPYNFRPITGGVIANRYKLAQSNGDCPPKGILEIDAASAEKPDQIGYKINRSGSNVVVEIFPLNMTPPLGAAPKPAAEKLETIPPWPPEGGALAPAGKEAFGKAPAEQVPPETLERKPGAEPLVSINVKDANVVDVLQVICTQAGINNIIDPSVVGRVSLTLIDTPLSVVLELLGEQADFDFYIKYGIYNFARETVLEKKFPEFYGTWILELAYADPNQVRAILTSQGIVDARNIIVYNATAVGGAGNIFTANRCLLIRASEKDIKLALAIVREIDKPPLQIVYDVKIVQTSANIRENLGVSWLTNTNLSEGLGTMGFALQEKPVGEPNVAGGITEYFPQGLMRDPYTFNATLNYLASTGKAKILANPSISALNGQAATYFVGQTVPYRSTFQVSDIGRVTQRVAQEQVGITLNVSGVAASNKTVTMYIAPEISNLMELTDIGPRTANNRFSTVMRVSDGETFVMAGLINEEDRITKTKVPILGDMPLFGGLFKNKKTDIDRTELIIAITPHIIEPVDYLGPIIRRATGLEGLFTGK